MLDTLVAIALALCWIVGFFVSAQFLHQQSQIARKLDEIRGQGSGDRGQGTESTDNEKGLYLSRQRPI